MADDMAGIPEGTEWANVEYARLRAELLEMPGYLAKGRWDALGVMHQAWALTTNLLLKSVNDLETDPKLVVEMVQNARPNTFNKAMSTHVAVALMSSLAATVALVDHTKALTDQYTGMAFKQEFDARNAVLKSRGDAMFVRRFRNYAIHYGPPPLEYRASPPTSDTVWRGSFSLNSRKLLEWDRWGSVRKSFIEPRPGGLVIREVFGEYVRAMSDMYRWIFEQFPIQHGHEVDAANEKVRSMNLALSGGTIGSQGEFHEFMKKVGEEVSRTHSRADPVVEVTPKEVIP